MKRAICMISLLLLTAQPLLAEVCVKHHTRTDEYYYGGSVTPAEDRYYEVWFGEEKVAYIYDYTKMIIDVGNNSLTFINLGDSVYLETSLPLEWENIVDEEGLPQIEMYKTHAEVQEKDEMKEIDGRKCTGYLLTTYIPFQGTKYNETDADVWLSDEMPFDMKLYNEIHPTVLFLRNFHVESFGKITQYSGYPTMVKETTYLKGQSVETVNTLEEIKKIDAPEDVWKVPDGFEKKERLRISELRGR
jgi:hypothetical protein